MKKYMLAFVLFFGSSRVTQGQVIVLEIIKAALNAADLVIQQIQNETIVLQNAQKELENAMSKLQLDGITDWVSKQKVLYEEYYQELATVKEIISGYSKIKSLVKMQASIVAQYQRAFTLFKQDRHFSEKELEYMFRVYTGIVDQSLKNLDQALLVVGSLSTSMTDAERMRLIDESAHAIQKNDDDLRRFTHQNEELSLQRSKSREETMAVKSLYGN